ncbi:MAG: hypothetical protein A2504_04725 [Bdellovibrionales bacterium RIFOXYD12_FULL_39_22]|nr:MAG: hypothetical protein A2385_07100 [Bdellovibrionales bacterium RIFOXYB1_FULL_39_21]OFZ42029.1 MAG: hypothetical protein A2485_09070 [Bdellovibrionales bacterium RIFOXYC12_FULL_39_17]OFZ50745.1 MAG: hypothetical protein A2404_06020 [Bdellovibrionales bacterium RIFOXYC1_FULL_39_130]OFZ77968.1 MAG: hypothetical protein A2560_01190 [Bdellovibrionales bacterium RIFOXYD1_FULL_39_84]OFZ93596.1 MAG: hypothetical protein A2504_04725 [Bdellovibrionales bacterium RIFOXYD12_FULL_39_22]HLE10280.1 hy
MKIKNQRGSAIIMAVLFGVISAGIIQYALVNHKALTSRAQAAGDAGEAIAEAERLVSIGANLIVNGYVLCKGHTDSNDDGYPDERWGNGHSCRVAIDANSLKEKFAAAENSADSSPNRLVFKIGDGTKNSGEYKQVFFEMFNMDKEEAQKTFGKMANAPGESLYGYDHDNWGIMITSEVEYKMSNATIRNESRLLALRRPIGILRLSGGSSISCTAGCLITNPDVPGTCLQRLPMLPQSSSITVTNLGPGYLYAAQAIREEGGQKIEIDLFDPANSNFVSDCEGGTNNDHCLAPGKSFQLAFSIPCNGGVVTLGPSVSTAGAIRYYTDILQAPISPNRISQNSSVSYVIMVVVSN